MYTVGVALDRRFPTHLLKEAGKRSKKLEVITS